MIELLLKLAAAGNDAIEEATDRAGMVDEIGGVLNGVYEPGGLERLSEDWPE